jgi:hypothetical protein
MAAKMSRSIVEFIPWDAESAEHIERLVQQRVDCGWHAGLVDGPWKEAQQAGTKCIYWIVSSFVICGWLCFD